MFYVSCYVHCNFKLSTLLKYWLKIIGTQITNYKLKELAVHEMHTIYINPVI